MVLGLGKLGNWTQGRVEIDGIQRWKFGKKLRGERRGGKVGRWELELAWIRGLIRSDWGTAVGKYRCKRLKRVIGRGVVDGGVGRRK